MTYDIYNIYREREREKIHSKLVYVGLAQARPNKLKLQTIVLFHDSLTKL